MPTPEHRRLRASEAREADWKNWGPYVSDRAWGTVREDYSDDGRAWANFPFEHAHRRSFRWNEDGLGGFCNRLQNVCMTLALWNGKDPVLKERLFGVSGPEGNHGEDVKEYYFHLDGLPSHAYMKMLYRYPHQAFPYEALRARNAAATRSDPEAELIDVFRSEFDQSEYFDVFIEYAKASDEDILCRISVSNRASERASIHVLPQLLFRNTWSWGTGRPVPSLVAQPAVGSAGHVRLDDRHLGTWHWYATSPNLDDPQLLFTDNNSAADLLRPGEGNAGSAYAKDAFSRFVVNGEAGAVNPAGRGTKCAAHFELDVEARGSATVDVRFCRAVLDEPFADADQVVSTRLAEANAFYNTLHPVELSDDERLIQRQALAGLLWTKQFYHYSVSLWLDGDPGMKPLPQWRHEGRNAGWRHLYNLDVISMPDKWEYPWYAAWDLAFHMLPTALIDPEWAKRQLELMLRQWYMHPNGQIPAYEWSFGDVNPPVHAWATLKVFDQSAKDEQDVDFLERVFQKLLLNFTWWVNQKDENGNNVFEGGFLGLDNIGVFNRSRPFPPGVLLEQADGTAWMAMYCLDMLAIALRIADRRPTYEDIATKFFEHFIYIANSINRAASGSGLWDEEDGFYYDSLHLPDGTRRIMRVRSFVGLIALFAVGVFPADTLAKLPRFTRRMAWFERYRPELASGSFVQRNADGDLMLSVVSRDRVGRLLDRLLDEHQFLSDFGLRSLSREYFDKPFTLEVYGDARSIHYEPAESTSGMFGGNSNWRGPIWLPLNYLMIDALRRYGRFYGDALTVDFPSGSGSALRLDAVASQVAARLKKIFLADPSNGRRPLYGGVATFRDNPDWHDRLLFYEYFHGDNGAGIGASHQTGWTALIANLIQEEAASVES
jgi:hypothetical protein